MLTKTGTIVLLAQDFSVDPPRSNPNDVCARCHAGKEDHRPGRMWFADVREKMRARAMPSGATSEDEHWEYWKDASTWAADRKRAERERGRDGKASGAPGGGGSGRRVVLPNLMPVMPCNIML